MSAYSLSFLVYGFLLAPVGMPSPGLDSAQPQDAQNQNAEPHWIWMGEPQADQELIFRKQFELTSVPAEAWISGSCDNRMIVIVNGERIGVHSAWERVAWKDVRPHLVEGTNTLEVRASNEGGPAGLAMRLTLGERVIATDSTWQVAIPARARRGRWSQADELGRVGESGLPWGNRITLGSFQARGFEMLVDRPGTPQAPQRAEALNLLDGFEADLLYTVPNEKYGSWVALTRDHKGRLYTSDQGKRGLYRVTPAVHGEEGTLTSVERIPVDVSGAQGMCWAFDSLYVNVNGQGLWRIQDTDGDDILDSAENLIPLGYGGEHGPHAVLPTEDGQGLYFIGGNHVKPPEFQGSQAPANWGEDLLLPRQWDPRGHARGYLAPGGWIARCDPDGKNIQILSTGYRNQFDIALNHGGEMFTYDADMEWDIGSPWYRPTRLCHVTSGSEFGWRSGTGKWPTYYEDSLPPTLEIGPGSPTGIVFGYGTNFPERYQEALFLLDWTFGTIYAVHLEPDGASYRATKEDFVWSKPLGVTDAIVGLDGALYFTVGGRGSQSALYRVRYAGGPVEASAPVADAGAPARELRRELEAFHGQASVGAVEAAWPHLAHADRFVRYAARIAVENQPVEQWRERARSEANPHAAVMASIALARQGSQEDLAGVLDVLAGSDWANLPESGQLAALRAYALAFVRLGEPTVEQRRQVRAQLEEVFPSGSRAVDTELVRLLTYLQSPTVVRETLALMRSAEAEELPPWAELIQRNDSYGGPIAKMLADMPPVQNIGLAFLLRNATEGWTLPLRKEYFEFFVSASKHPGGASFSGFLENARKEAAANLSVGEQQSLASLLGQSLVAALPANITPPRGPGQKWTHAAAVEAVGTQLTQRSYAAGRNLFHAASCSTCHRFDGEGGAIGPDLTTVANKFSLADILEAIVEPDKVISDQYGSHLVVDTDGLMYEGILVEDVDEITIYSRDLDKDPVTLDRSEIETLKESTLSQMPSGLVDPLSADELRDLLAYLVSGGDEKAAVFGGEKQAGQR